MFLTEQEILDTPNALKKTCSLFREKRDEITAFFQQNPQRKFLFLGCGSSYMLAKSAATVFATLPDTAAIAVAAGDYIVNPELWREAARGCILVSISRSGRTSEMVRAVGHMRSAYGCPVVSLSMEEGNDIMPMSDLNLTMEWCYDRSVCQTRTVTNLYAALLLLAASYAGDRALAVSVEQAAAENATFQRENRPALEKIAALPWKNVTVLADGPICGIAEEGALAFTEIAMLSGRYFHLLDYRHGPVVIGNKDTLTLMLLSPGDETLQEDMVRDVLAHGGPVVTLSGDETNIFGSHAHITMPKLEAFAAWGILFVYVAQMLALLKAIELGGNPDAPAGLDAYITLK